VPVDKSTAQCRTALRLIKVQLHAFTEEHGIARVERQCGYAGRRRQGVRGMPEEGRDDHAQLGAVEVPQKF
jgi:hypothetical protein